MTYTVVSSSFSNFVLDFSLPTGVESSDLLSLFKGQRSDWMQNLITIAIVTMQNMIPKTYPCKKLRQLNEPPSSRGKYSSGSYFMGVRDSRRGGSFGESTKGTKPNLMSS